MKSRAMFRTPQAMLRKQVGQFNKIFGLWGQKNQPKIPAVTLNKKNPDIVFKGTPVFLEENKGLNQKYVTRRQIVLNRHFTEIVSDVLSNSMRQDLKEIGVTITSIETKAWNKGLDIFYYTERSKDQLGVQNQLQDTLTKLKSSVTERRLIGRTPPINFVYDEGMQFTQAMEEAMQKVSEIKVDDVPETELVQRNTEELQTSKRSRKGASKLEVESKEFDSPSDMTNEALGFDYVDAYNEVSSKLPRGRAHSERVIPKTNIASNVPLMRKPEMEPEDSVDPRVRLLKIQNFLKNQRLKVDRHAKLRRKEELLYRDSLRYTVIDVTDDTPPDLSKQTFEEDEKLDD